eukprot:12866821-Alexandrium_andersonii.AAC.1
MSASLVGSEMCIRDRQQEHHRRQRQCRYQHQNQDHDKTHKYTDNGNNSSCLLYTSDAADDM